MKFTCTFHISCPIFEIQYRCSHAAEHCSENHSLLNDVIHFCLYFAYLLCDLGELWYKVSEHNAVSIYEFNEN